MKKPPFKLIEIDRAKVLELIRLTRVGPLCDEDHDKLKAMMETMLWLMGELEAQKTSAKRLCRLLFGPTSEKTSDVLGDQADNGADPFDYLVALLKHPEQIAASPGDWIPWNYQQALQQFVAAAAVA